MRHTTKKVGDGLESPAKIEYKNGRVKTRPYINYPNNKSIQSALVPRNLPFATCHLQLDIGRSADGFYINDTSERR